MNGQIVRAGARSSLSQKIGAYRRAAGLAMSGGMGAARAWASVLKARVTYGFGPTLYALYRFYEKPERTWSDYLKDIDFKPVLRVINLRAQRAMAADKLSFYWHCRQNAIPVADVELYLGPEPDGVVYGEFENRFCRNQAAFANRLECLQGPLFFKPIKGSHGAGAFVLRREAGEWTVRGRPCSPASVYDYCLSNMERGSGWLVQQALVPHPELRGIMPAGALGTLRIVSFLDGSEAKLLLAVIRLPAGGNQTDNFSGGVSGNIVAPVDLDTGVIGMGRMSRSRQGPVMEAVSTHPDSGAAIAGVVVPMWDRVREVVLTAQARTPGLRTLGWDVAVVAEGVVVIEANAAYDVDLLQVAMDRPVAAELAPVMRAAAHAR